MQLIDSIHIKYNICNNIFLLVSSTLDVVLNTLRIDDNVICRLYGDADGNRMKKRKEIALLYGEYTTSSKLYRATLFITFFCILYSIHFYTVV